MQPFCARIDAAFLDHRLEYLQCYQVHSSSNKNDMFLIIHFLPK
jgi:hypothetical protein